MAGGGSYRAEECPCESFAGENTCYIKEKNKSNSVCGTVTQGYSINPLNFFAGSYYRDCDPLYDVHCPDPEISEEMINARIKLEDEREREREAELARLQEEREAYANSEEKRAIDMETKRIQDEYEQSIKKTRDGRILLKEWFGGINDYAIHKLSNSALLDSAQLFSLGKYGSSRNYKIGKYENPMLGRSLVKKLKQPNNKEIQLMSKAAVEILNSDDNWRRMKKDRELNKFYNLLDERHNAGF